MACITLSDLKARPINSDVAALLERTMELSTWNNSVRQRRMADEHGRESNIWDMTHDGNDPKENGNMLDVARLYYEKHVYSDEEWEQYFLPAINAMMEYNDKFIRWRPGYVIRDRKTLKRYIVEYDYAQGYGGRNFTDLSVCNLGDDDEIHGSWAWANYKDYDLVDSDHTEKYIAKMQAYNKGKTPPYCLCSKLSNLYYGMESSPMPARKKLRIWEKK